MQHISSHITGPESRKKERITERGELMKFFLDKLNCARVQDGLAPMTMGRMGKTLEAIPTKDLYYLKSVCEQASNFSKKFWWEINPKNHTPEKIKEREVFWEKQNRKRAQSGQYSGQVSQSSPRPFAPRPQANTASPPTPRSRD